MEKELNLWVEDMKRECVLIDDIVLYQKILSLSEDYGKGPLKLVDSKPFTAMKGWCHRFRNRFDILSSHTITGRRVSTLQ